ncbi:MAG: amidohydrolase family protein [Proteobacteria bacterium]|nr:amidohydrolase family protein [Pseudomonadota bacterium]
MGAARLRHVAALAGVGLALCGPAAGAATRWLANAHLIDGRNAAEVPLVDVRIEGRTIAAIEPAAPRPGAVDLKGRYLLPGFVDAHAHIQDPAAARRALLAGVTTARVLGDAYLKALGTRDLIRAGHAQGPELLASGGIIRPRLGEPFILPLPQFGRFLEEPLTGVDNVRAVARALIERHVDVLKVGASERAGLADTDPRRPELSYEEIRAVVEEGARAGLYVAAHAHGRAGANAAVRAGVRSIEHGTYLDEETLELMRRQGTFLVPTLAIMSPLGDPRGDSADAIALQLRTRAMMRPLREVVRKAHALGIPIAAGTDGDYGEGDGARVRPAHEIEELIAVGFTPLEAISAATYQAARLLGIERRTGSVAVGLEADLVVVERDPRRDPTTLFEPLLVVSDGAVVLDRLD